MPDGLLGPISTIPHAGQLKRWHAWDFEPAAGNEASDGV